ncbi:SET domain-containing protein 4 [Anopheles aquasalis]|uniref:SET domain-containing protein 4 n=1 Tax=Anopheles aquasalis TaxID=42839 RepID=UPI00215AEA51|nr:SET domain-containing protein 4 [Anopheles aquasalis]
MVPDNRMAPNGSEKKCAKTPRECLDHVDLCRWLKGLGWPNETRLRIAAFPETGKGLFSRKTIAAGERLISLPFEALLGGTTIEQDESFRAMFDPESLEEQDRPTEEKVSFQALLAFYLCAQEHQSNPTLAPYLNSLPSHFSNPYFCAKQELGYLPEVLLTVMVKQNQQIKSEFEKLINTLRPEWRTVFSLERFKWAHFVVNTRSVYVDPEIVRMINSFLPNGGGGGSLFDALLSDAPSMALAPFLDFFNHQSGTKTVSKLSLTVIQIRERLAKGKPLELFYDLFIEREFERGAQIYISYGTHNNTSLLLEYGFFLPNNPNDFVELTLEDVNGFIRHDPELRCLRLPREKYRFLSDHQLNEQLFFVEDDLLSHNLTVCLTILFVEQNIHNMRTIAFGSTPPLDPIRSLVHRLLDYLVLQMHRSIAGLTALPNLTASANAYREYRRECVEFLNKIKNKL